MLDRWIDDSTSELGVDIGQRPWAGRLAAPLLLVWLGLAQVAIGNSIALVQSSPTTTRVSVTNAGLQVSDNNAAGSVSADGKKIAFVSWAQLVAGDTDSARDVYVRDVTAGTTTLVSVAGATGGSNGDNFSPVISSDGKRVAFVSYATNLVTPPSSGRERIHDVYLRNLVAGTTTLVSASSTAGYANGASFAPSISEDGSFVAFVSYATDLTAVATGGHPQVFVRNTATGATTIVSAPQAPATVDGPSDSPSISADGRYIAFTSQATNLVAGSVDLNSAWDIYGRDLQTGTTTRVSSASSGQPARGHCITPSISANGSHVAFASLATNLVAPDSNGTWDVFVRRNWQLPTATTIRISTGGNGPSRNPSIWYDALPNNLKVAFYSGATNFVSGDSNGVEDVYLYTSLAGGAGSFSRVTWNTTGSGDSNGRNLWPTLSADGHWVAFPSAAENLVAGDSNGFVDVFVRGSY